MRKNTVESELNRCIEQKFMDLPTTSYGGKLDKLYFKYCTANKIPHIRVDYRRKYASIWIDVDGNARLDETAKGEIRFICAPIEGVKIGSEDISGIPRELAPEIARKLFDIGKSWIDRRPSPWAHV